MKCICMRFMHYLILLGQGIAKSSLPTMPWNPSLELILRLRLIGEKSYEYQLFRMTRRTHGWMDVMGHDCPNIQNDIDANIAPSYFILRLSCLVNCRWPHRVYYIEHITLYLNNFHTDNIIYACLIIRFVHLFQPHHLSVPVLPSVLHATKAPFCCVMNEDRTPPALNM